MNSFTLLAHLDERDRALFSRFALDGSVDSPFRSWWCSLTHLGGATGSILLACSAVLIPGASLWMAWDALLVLGLSHLIVQIVKRYAVRERPDVRLSWRACVSVPDKFSFPSGHACSVMSVAYVLSLALPQVAWFFLPLALVVGCSRVALGVHYPGDVLVGQGIAIGTAHAFLFVQGLG